ncbi:MAG: HlyD family efflux transporter periplasmic adaptor subunit [Massilia sp.]|nr:HlyD family efflux transporter periplasmic adaptor subunit [Massilia sp.]
MDAPAPKRRGKRLIRVALGAAVVALLAVGGWYAMPRGLQVQTQDVRLAAVEKGTFVDDIVVRATTEPLKSVILDSVESGRVEEVSAKDGAMVKKGQLLFRLSNPQRNLELLARQAETAQQISNLSTLRVAQETSRTDHQRRLSDLEFQLSQVEKQHARNVKLRAQGFISEVALEESADKLAQQRRALKEEHESIDTEARVKRDAIEQMGTAIRGLQSGLQLVNATVDALVVRAPVDGMLTGFRLQVGETVRTDQHIGRIDDPNRFKLTAQVDEFYLSRVAVGRHGAASSGEKAYPVTVSTIYPQIKEGRFTVEMEFTKGQPEVLSPGQSMDTHITLGEPAKATLLPNAPFINETGGTWVFVLGRDGESVTRRLIRTGRRSNTQIEILSGLEPGEKVIVSSYAAFDKAERLQLTR